MSSLRSLLQDADPFRHEPQCPDDALERVRLQVLSGAPTHRVSRPARARVTLVGALTFAIVGFFALGYQFWQHGTATLLAAVRFEVRLAEERPIPGLVVAQVADSGKTIYLHPGPVVTNEDIAHSWVSQDGQGRFGVTVELFPSGAERIRQATTGHVGRPIAILLDGSVVRAPLVRSPITDSAAITGFVTHAEADRIAKGIEIR